jgi:TolB-like protein
MMKKLMMVTVVAFLAASAFAQAKPRLAILPFTGGSGRDGDSIANIFANSGDLKQEFDIVPRTSSVESVMKEQQFQRSGLTDSDTIARLGKQMNADYVVAGHITPFRNINLLFISIVNVQTMQQVAGDHREYDKTENIRALLPQMAQNIIRSIRGQRGESSRPLAVLPLNIRDAAVQQSDAEILAQILSIEIANSHQYAVFPRTSTIEAVMKEHEIQKSGLTDRSSMIEIGKATNAEYVLAGTITKLGDMNLFDVKILNIESGVQAEGVDREYTDLSDGIALMAELAYALTGVEAGRYAEARQQERRMADEAEQQREADRRQQEEERKRQDAQNFRNGLNKFFRGRNRLTSIGVNIGVGIGNGVGMETDEKLGINGFGNISVTIPLVWTLFAEGGIDLGFSGTIDYDSFRDAYNEKYSATRPYGRLNIGLPLGDEDDFLCLLYTGAGYGYMSASYEYDAEVDGHTTKTLEYGGMDLVFGAFFIFSRHHGMRLMINLNTILEKKYFEYQSTLGYVYRF